MTSWKMSGVILGAPEFEAKDYRATPCFVGMGRASMRCIGYAAYFRRLRPQMPRGVYSGYVHRQPDPVKYRWELSPERRGEIMAVMPQDLL